MFTARKTQRKSKACKLRRDLKVQYDCYLVIDEIVRVCPLAKEE